MSSCIWKWFHVGISIDQMVILTEQEIEQLNDDSWLKRKKAITGKLEDILTASHQQLADIRKPEVMDPFFKKGVSGRISRGDNYQDLPYLVLDYPKLSDKNEMHTFRIIVWWGNGILLNFLHSGKILHLMNKKLLTEAFEDWYVDGNDNPWEHEITPADKLIGKLGLSTDYGFLKISRQIPFRNINTLPAIAEQTYTKWLTCF